MGQLYLSKNDRMTYFCSSQLTWVDSGSWNSRITPAALRVPSAIYDGRSSFFAFFPGWRSENLMKPFLPSCSLLLTIDKKRIQSINGDCFIQGEYFCYMMHLENHTYNSSLWLFADMDQWAGRQENMKRPEKEEKRKLLVELSDVSELSFIESLPWHSAVRCGWKK